MNALNSNYDGIKEFSDYAQACNYAKQHPGLIMIRKDNLWFVGDRKFIYPLSAQRSGGSTNQHKKQTQKNNFSSHCEDDDGNNDESAEDRDSELYMEELYEEMDPDDWNRSDEEGWFYAE